MVSESRGFASEVAALVCRLVGGAGGKVVEVAVSALVTVDE